MNKKMCCLKCKNVKECPNVCDIVLNKSNFTDYISNKLKKKEIIQCKNCTLKNCLYIDKLTIWNKNEKKQVKITQFLNLLK